MSEMIKGPRERGKYPDRWLDCQHALEPVFLQLVEQRDTAFIDLATISGPIFDIAYAAGWDVDDVAAAVEELAVNYQLGVWANRRTDAAIANALSRAAKQKP